MVTGFDAGQGTRLSLSRLPPYPEVWGPWQRRGFWRQMLLSHWGLSNGSNGVPGVPEVTVVVLLAGETVQGTDGVSYEDVSSGVSDSGVAGKGNDPEFGSGIAGNLVGGEGGGGWRWPCQRGGWAAGAGRGGWDDAVKGPW